MNLLLDIGNTRVKWRYWRHGKLMDGGVLGHRDFLEGLRAGSLELATPRRILVACVGSEALKTELQSAVAARWSLSAEFFLATGQAGGVVNGYECPERLGVDRWLALVGARGRSHGPLLVVDAGSALTLDVLNHEGRHLGGLIVPGLEMMRTSLLGGTGLVRFEPQGEIRPTEAAAFGRNTEAAVKFGTYWSAVNLIEGMRSRVRLLLAEEPVCMLTGGDASGLAAMLSNIELVPDLVLEGLVLQAGLELVR